MASFLRTSLGTGLRQGSRSHRSIPRSPSPSESSFHEGVPFVALEDLKLFDRTVIVRGRIETSQCQAADAAIL